MLLYKNKIKLEFQLLLDKTNEFRHSVILRLNFFNGHNAIAYKNFLASASMFSLPFAKFYSFTCFSMFVIVAK
jgi:hypothetical protein